MVVLIGVQVVLLGVLAGEELAVRWGVQPALSALSDDAHVRTRIALVQRLKVAVPVVMVPMVLALIALLALSGGTNGFWWRAAGLAALVGFVLFSFLGTVPINIGVNDWDPEHPPADWRDVVARWQRIDVFRSTAAAVAFVLFVVALLVER